MGITGEYDGQLDLAEGLDFLLDGGDVKFCYMEVHGDDYRPFCLDPHWNGIMGSGPEELGFTLYVGLLLCVGLYFTVRMFLEGYLNRKN